MRQNMRFAAAAPMILLCLAAALPARAADSGTILYPASFFDSAHPATANDMITRLPGFSLDTGNSARGFAGTAGNVLIDGTRPTAKTDDLQTILTRIPAGDVDRIELIRGGAPGTVNVRTQGSNQVSTAPREEEGILTELYVCPLRPFELVFNASQPLDSRQYVC